MAPDYGNEGTHTSYPTVGNCADTTGGFIHFYPISSSNHVEVLLSPDRKQAHRDIMRGVVAGQRTIREQPLKTLRTPKPHFVWKPQRF